MHVEINVFIVVESYSTMNMISLNIKFVSIIRLHVEIQVAKDQVKHSWT